MSINKTDIINKLFEKQLNDVEPKYRLNSKDIIRLSSYINSDPFDENICCKWLGAISKSTHNSKYINFWFNKKKQALHRILFLNYKGELPKNKYLRFNCPNQNMKGICCNINHYELINKEEYEKELNQTNIDQETSEQATSENNVISETNNENSFKKSDNNTNTNGIISTNSTNSTNTDDVNEQLNNFKTKKSKTSTKKQNSEAEVNVFNELKNVSINKTKNNITKDMFYIVFDDC